MDSLEAVFVDELTPQELVVLGRLSEPGTYAEIAREMYVSRNTIKSHVSHIFLKLGVTDRESAIAWADHLGLFRAENQWSEEGERPNDGRFVITEAAARRYFSDVANAMRERDWSAYSRLHRPDAVRITPVSSCYGVEAMIEQAVNHTDAMPDSRIELVNVTVDGDGNRAIFEGVMRGTLTGPLKTLHGTIPGTGRAIRILGVEVVTFDEAGLAAEIRRYWDLHEIIREHGLSDDAS